MVLKISQETFNNAVQENIEDLGLDPDEAVSEAVAQFESQGVDLSAILKELMISPSETELITEEVKKLSDLNKKKEAAQKVIEQLETIKTACEKGLQHKVVAGKAGAYNVILNTLTQHKNNPDVKKNCLKTLIALMSKQPDLLDDQGLSIIISNLQKDTDLDIKKYTLRWAKECCILHEQNRQKIFNAHITNNIKELLTEGSSDVLKDLLGVCRALTLDDDIRVQFGKAHEHARVIASETLCLLINLLNRYKLEELLVNDLILTISTLMVRTEFCKKVEDAGGLEQIKEVMKSHSSSEKINRQCFKLLKALAGNDECKLNILQKQLAPTIREALQLYKNNAQTASAGLACVAALTLRCPENSKTLFETGLPAVIVLIMRENTDDKSIQKFGSWAIRNMVSRSKYQCKTFLELGAEELLRNGLKKFKSDIEYDVKAALRDLGCNVNLKEEWTGKGGALTTGLRYSDHE